MILPNILIVGPMKSGTSWIYQYLKYRRDIGLPNGVKETFFFDRYYDKGVEWYSSHYQFISGKQYKQVVEVAPSYFHCQDAPERIYNVLGDISILVTLRDPVRRAWSHYLHLRRYGYTSAPLKEAIREFPEILEASKYKTNLARWHNYFPERRVEILRQECLSQSPEKYIKQLCSVMSLSSIKYDSSLNQKYNKTTLPRFT